MRDACSAWFKRGKTVICCFCCCLHDWMMQNEWTDWRFFQSRQMLVPWPGLLYRWDIIRFSTTITAVFCLLTDCTIRRESITGLLTWSRVAMSTQKQYRITLASFWHVWKVACRSSKSSVSNGSANQQSDSITTRVGCLRVLLVVVAAFVVAFCVEPPPAKLVLPFRLILSTVQVGAIHLE